MRRESPSCSDEFPAGCLCDLGKGTPHLFSSPISFAYLSSSLTVCNGVPPVWPPVVAAEQTPGSSLQPFAFIFILFVFTFRKMCPTDAQKCVLLAGHQCDDCQWTGQRRKVALLIMCKLGTNLAPQNAALPRRSRGHLATPSMVGLLEVCTTWLVQRLRNKGISWKAIANLSVIHDFAVCKSGRIHSIYKTLMPLSFILLPLSTQAWELE